jgi:PAS domain S-box-containing protein
MVKRNSKIDHQLSHQQQEYFEALFEQNPAAMVTVDMDGNVVRWNPAAEELFGYSQKEAVGRNVDDLVANHDSVRAEARRITVQLSSLNDERWQSTTKRTRKDGSLFDVELIGVPVFVGDQLVGGIAIYYDITPQKRIEEELRYQKEYYEALFVNSPVAIGTVDQKGEIVSWNQAAEKLFGYTQEEVIGQNIDDMVAKDPSISEEAARYTQQTINMEHVHAITKRTRKDGTLVDVELLSVPVIISGEVVGYIALYYDISELLEARKAAEDANQAKSEFLARMSHELRTPLNAIIGFTRIVQRKGAESLPEKQLDNLEKVLVSANHLLQLINDILDLSKIEAGRMEVELTSFNAESLIDLCISTGKPLIKPRVSLVKQIDDGLPLVISDQNKVKQVLLNLLSNAAKFTEEGEINISAKAEGDTLIISVADTGIGISEEALVQIFDEFQQADMSTTREYGGTGLGLSISRRLAKLLGGNLVAESIEGQGSIFSLTIPLHFRMEGNNNTK